MTRTMVSSAMLPILMHIFLVSRGVWCLEPEDGDSLLAGVLDLPWQDELCCDSHTTHFNVEGGGAHTPGTNGSESVLPHQPHCSFKSLTSESRPHEPFGHSSSFNTGICLDILCRIDETWEKLTCDVKSHGQTSVSLDGLKLQRLSQTEDPHESAVSDNPIVCEAEDSFVCSVPLYTSASYITVVTIGISSATSLPVHLRIPPRPVKPKPPVNLSHIQTIDAELILLWDDPADCDAGPLRYEVRYTFNSTHPAWQVVSAPAEPRQSLDLKPRLNYTVQVRCSGLEEPPLWSDWSESHHIYLNIVSYIPDKVVARPGENVTVYCVFNDHSFNASMALWVLNWDQQLHHSQYHPVNQWVSQITVHPSESRMYDLLQCTQEWTHPYSQIYVEGASIDINCKTNGDIDSMECSWENTQWTKTVFRNRWADVPCYVMEERDKAGEKLAEKLGETEPTCLHVRSREETCTIQPLRMNCYKLWLEVPSRLGPISSKPIYLSPIDHVKPHPPTNVRAVSRSSGVLRVTWEPPSLPVEGLQCQFRYHSPSTVRAQPEWKVQNSVWAPGAEVVVPDMCRVYVVQVRCMHTNGTGYWSEWSDSVYSTPQNSRAPQRGPDFWRILQDDPYRNQTNVTLLFEDLPISGHSYCVNGFIVQHQTSSGAVMRRSIELVSSYSFEWNQELQTVTVEAYNSLGSSTNNINMTLERRPKRHSVHSFCVLVINSTCVSLSWSLQDNSSVPLFMVVQWLPQRQQESDQLKAQSGQTWARLPYTDRPVYLRGDFFGSEEYGFYLYPVFAEGEGEPVYAIATRRDPAAYMMLLIISFLSIVLFVTLMLSQNQMKRFVWKDVPNPKKCSWAQGLDFKKADFDHLFRPPESLSAWPLLLPSENISKVVIVDKADFSSLTTALVHPPLVSLTTDPAVTLAVSLSPAFDSEVEHTKFKESEALTGGAPSFALDLDALAGSYPMIDELQPVTSHTDQPTGSGDTSAQSSVTYATVLLTDPKQEQHLHYKEGSGSSSSDEGNFSANNSDISGSFLGGLWELDDPRRSCSYNSVEELSETSEQGDEGKVGNEDDLYYLGLDYPAEDEESEEEEQVEEETKIELCKNMVLNRDDCSVESRPLLGTEDSSGTAEPLSHGLSALYLPQFRTAPCTRQPQDSRASAVTLAQIALK
ncbi:leptin receptor [Solea solea]|uniref:leptin receptor n=1 Tax=Solea solea TaxID=90069 RepID=UPI00272CED14|nr:leptin receptor [Solea solea]XP_058494847.1 leptin receptor [Solea solea]